ncbi:MAG: hypothetical protein AB7G11_07025 [Phycisphaerales bacterium]
MFRELQRQVSDALAHEAATGELAAYAMGVFGDMCGNDPSRGTQIETKTELAVAFIRQYVQATPLLLEAIESAAEAANVKHDLLPVLTAAEDYFLQSVDFIPDHLGLAGVIDDAYLAQSLLQVLSDSHKGCCGEALIPFDLAPANALIRRMIGEPTATSLDAAVQEALGLPDVQTARESLARKVKALRLAGAPAFPALAIDDDMNLQLGALGNA